MVSRISLMDYGFSHLADGPWFLAPRCWIMVSRISLMDHGFSHLAAGSWFLAPRCWIMVSRTSLVDHGVSHLADGSWFAVSQESDIEGTNHGASFRIPDDGRGSENKLVCHCNAVELNTTSALANYTTEAVVVLLLISAPLPSYLRCSCACVLRAIDQSLTLSRVCGQYSVCGDGAMGPDVSTLDFNNSCILFCRRHVRTGSGVETLAARQPAADQFANAFVVLSSTAEDGEIEVRISVV
uniref:Uncharacterized protein n=1 Tax=Timema shepardi TaxID=629360 RepID=A0A7R9FVP2_TIMSH|nr:unnamed protein product [Timema shepardi]